MASLVRVLTPQGTVVDVAVDAPPAKRKIMRPPKSVDEPPHGTYGRWCSPYKCRCSECHKAYLVELKRLRLTAKQRMGEEAINHGTYYAYCKYSCRCPECVKANSDYQRKRRERWAAEGRKRDRSREKPPTPEQLARWNARKREKRKLKQLRDSVAGGGEA